jgi:hypothetical protein
MGPCRQTLWYQMPPMGMAGSGEVWEISVLSAQFCCELKTALRDSLVFKSGTSYLGEDETEQDTTAFHYNSSAVKFSNFIESTLSLTSYIHVYIYTQQT